MTDGRPNDADGMINGVIVDPVGVGVPAGEPVDDSIDEPSTTTVPTLPFLGLLLLTGLLALLGVGQRKMS